MQDAASRRGQGGTHRCNPPNSSLCLLEHPVGCIIDNSTELDTAILHCGALQHVQMSLAQKVLQTPIRDTMNIYVVVWIVDTRPRAHGMTVSITRNFPQDLRPPKSLSAK